MDCPNCKLSYNEYDRNPHLLTACGHSICQVCLHSLFHETSLECPVCHVINKAPNVHLFPKNLALIILKTTQLNQDSTDQSRQHTLSMEESIIDFGHHIVCIKHRKNIEAFCERDRVLLCINCILEDKKKEHELNSLVKAAQKERTVIEKAYELAKIVESKIEKIQEELQQSQRQLVESSEQSLINITKMFDGIRKVISEREDQLKLAVLEQLDSQKNIIVSHEERLLAHRQIITEFLTEAELSVSESDIKLLSGSKHRLEMMKKATETVSSIAINTSVKEVNKEQELAYIWKMLNPQSAQLNAQPTLVSPLKSFPVQPTSGATAAFNSSSANPEHEAKTLKVQLAQKTSKNAGVNRNSKLPQKENRAVKNTNNPKPKKETTQSYTIIDKAPEHRSRDPKPKEDKHANQENRILSPLPNRPGNPENTKKTNESAQVEDQTPKGFHEISKNRGNFGDEKSVNTPGVILNQNQDPLRTYSISCSPGKNRLESGKKFLQHLSSKQLPAARLERGLKEDIVGEHRRNSSIGSNLRKCVGSVTEADTSISNTTAVPNRFSILESSEGGNNAAMALNASLEKISPQQQFQPAIQQNRFEEQSKYRASLFSASNNTTCQPTDASMNKDLNNSCSHQNRNNSQASSNSRSNSVMCNPTTKLTIQTEIGNDSGYYTFSKNYSNKTLDQTSNRGGNSTQVGRYNQETERSEEPKADEQYLKTNETFTSYNDFGETHRMELPNESAMPKLQLGQTIFSDRVLQTREESTIKYTEEQKSGTFDTRNDSMSTNSDLLNLLTNGDAPKCQVKPYNAAQTYYKRPTERILPIQETPLEYQEGAERYKSYVSRESYVPSEKYAVKQEAEPLPPVSSIYVIGGFVESTEAVIERFDLEKREWEVVHKVLNNRTKFVALPLPGNKVLLMGGKRVKDSERLRSCEELDIRENVLKPSQIYLTKAKSGFGALLFKDHIFLCGGNDGSNILKVFEQVNIKTRVWKPLPSLQYKRDELSLAIGKNNYLYAIGGFGGPENMCLNSVEKYNLTTGVWEPAASMNVPRRALATVTLADGIYAIGGYDGANYLNTVERYDEEKDQWVVVAPLNHARCTLAAVATPDLQAVYVFGGFDGGPLSSVEMYSISKNKWELLTPMNYKRFMHSSVMV